MSDTLTPATDRSEASRLQALHALDILDTAPESVFDEAVALAASICGTPMAMLSLLDGKRQWFKARVGLDTCELPQEHSFCSHLLGQNAPMVVPDATEDTRFRANPYVTAEPHLRFYAGAPLNTTDGNTLGTLCVVDTVPHQLSPAQIEALNALGRQVTAQIELRAKVQLLARVLQEKEAMERELRNRTMLFSAFMDHSPTIGFIKDREGRFLYYNLLFCERFAVSATEWIGKNVFDVFPEEFAAAYHDLDMSVLRTGTAQVVEESSPGPNNTTFYWRTHKFLVSDGSESVLLGGLCLDISQEREAEIELQRSHQQLKSTNQQLTELSVTDGLTGLRNRRAFDDRLAREMAAGHPLSLLLLDVDHFKALNDGYGHPAGDEVLRTLAKLLAQQARGSDFVARFGGEEFAILLPGIGPSDALLIAERLRNAVENFAWQRARITVSIGLATRSAAFGNPVELVEAADTALYIAKHRGRNRVESANDVEAGTVTTLPASEAPACLAA